MRPVWRPAEKSTCPGGRGGRGGSDRRAGPCPQPAPGLTAEDGAESLPLAELTHGRRTMGTWGSTSQALRTPIRSLTWSQRRWPGVAGVARSSRCSSSSRKAEHGRGLGCQASVFAPWPGRGPRLRQRSAAKEVGQAGGTQCAGPGPTETGASPTGCVSAPAQESVPNRK